MSDTYNAGATVPELFRAHEERHKEAREKIAQLERDLTAAVRERERAQVEANVAMQVARDKDEKITMLEHERDDARAEVARLREDAELWYAARKRFVIHYDCNGKMFAAFPSLWLDDNNTAINQQIDAAIDAARRAG